MEIESIETSINDIQKQFGIVKNLQNILKQRHDELDQDDKSKEFIESFYEHAEKTMQFLKDNLNKIKEKYVGVAKYFCMDPNKDKLADFVSILKEFKKMFAQEIIAYKKSKDKRERLAKMHNRRKG